MRQSATAPEGWALDPLANPDLPASYTNYGHSLIDLAGPGGDWDWLTGRYDGDLALPRRIELEAVHGDQQCFTVGGGELG